MDVISTGTSTSLSPPPLVSIVCPAYNQQAYIAQTLEGFLMQQTTFAFEILINDDASTDDTARIIADYAKRYPALIRPFYQETNQYSQGNPPVPRLFGEACGRYIAYCEADDYWTDPHKLQIQVDFLESHPDYVLTYHDAVPFDTQGQYPVQLQGKLRGDATALELQKARPISTLTTVFRNVFDSLPRELEGAPLNDLIWWSLLGAHGKGKFMADIKPAAYRLHAGGVFSMRPDKRKLHMALQTSGALANYYNRLGNDDLYQHFLMELVGYSLSAMTPQRKVQTLLQVGRNFSVNIGKRLVTTFSKRHVQ